MCLAATYPAQSAKQLDSTQCIQLSFYRDATPADWGQVLTSPVRTLDTLP